MGTFFYIIFRLLGLIDTGRDLVIICFLVSLDSIGVPALIKMIRGDS
ncbi:MAG: hypothetical protein KKA19_09550 [Candidatus Margulisbacteria bacterium]|nr:hypothetical protein [Candidatus Margulisiibacteriota bacterium]